MKYVIDFVLWKENVAPERVNVAMKTKGYQRIFYTYTQCVCIPLLCQNLTNGIILVIINVSNLMAKSCQQNNK